MKPTILVAFVLFAGALTPGQSFPAANAEIEMLVKQALEDRLAANDVPDLNLIRGQTRVAILSEMRQSKLVLGSSVLPVAQGREFFLLSPATAQARADSEKQHVYFVFVDLTRINGETATLQMGTDFVFPRDAKTRKMCCCTGTGQFQRRAGRWTFVNWVTRICG